MYKQYLRDKNNNPIGLVIVSKDRHVGWSKCNKLDKFDKRIANIIAMNRLVRNRAKQYRDSEMPKDIEDLLNHLWYKTVGRYVEFSLD